MSIRSQSLTRVIKCGRVDHVYQVRYARLIGCPEVLIVQRLSCPLLSVYFEPNPGNNKNKSNIRFRSKAVVHNVVHNATL